MADTDDLIGKTVDVYVDYKCVEDCVEFTGVVRGLDQHKLIVEREDGRLVPIHPTRCVVV